MQNQAQLQSTFLSTLWAITEYDADSPPKIALAVSGGPDSIALLWLMRNYYHGEVYAASVDHELRPEAKVEAEHVAAICSEMDIPHEILRPDHPIIGNIQSSARAARYDLLQTFASRNDCRFIATAHHADDQLETMIMRLNRGSGVSGLAAIRERNGNVIRPLLSFRKIDLIKICQDADIVYAQDPSNENDDYDRVRVRKWLARIEAMNESSDVPALFKPDMVQKSAKYIDQAEQALQFGAQYFSAQRISKNVGSTILDASQLPAEYERRLLILALRQVSADIAPRGPALDNVIKALKSKEISMIGNVKCTPIETNHQNHKHIWRLELAPPRRQK